MISSTFTILLNVNTKIWCQTSRLLFCKYLRYHLQAFRHLYVLGVEPRLVIPKEVHIDEICYANLSVVKLNGTTINLKGPGIIPDLRTLIRVAVNDERYWPVLFEKGRNWELLE